MRYYVARSGQQCAFMLRNYQRKLGVLVDTHWELVEIELGLIEKVYDPIRDKHYFEKKVIKTRVGGLIAMEWISERVAEEDFIREAEEAETADRHAEAGSSELLEQYGKDLETKEDNI